MNTRKPIALLVAAVISTAAATAQSQQLEEVLVTAQKRTESAQDIPVALTAVSAATIEALSNLSLKLLFSLFGPKRSFRLAG